MTEFRKNIVVMHTRPEPIKKLTSEVFLPHPFLSISVKVRKSDGTSPNVIQKYWISPLDLDLSIKGMMNISPKKMILMNNQVIDSKVATLLHSDSNLMELVVVISVLKALDDHILIDSFSKLVKSSEL